MDLAISYQKFWTKSWLTEDWMPTGPGSPLNPEVQSAFGFAGEGYTGQPYNPFPSEANCNTLDVKTWPDQSMLWKWSGVH